MNKINKELLYRGYSEEESETLEVLVSADKRVSICYYPPGLMQISQAMELFINAYLPSDLSPEEKNGFSREELLEKSRTNLQSIIADGKTSEAEKNYLVYGMVIQAEGNSSNIKELIEDCFQLDANKLKTIVLIQLIHRILDSINEYI